jgi:hypothetical protein
MARLLSATAAVAIAVTAASAAASASEAVPPPGAQWFALTAKESTAASYTLAYLTANGTVVSLAAADISTPNEAAEAGTLRCGAGLCFFSTLLMSSPGAGIYNVSAADGTVHSHATFTPQVAPVLEYDTSTGTVYTLLSGGGKALVTAVVGTAGTTVVDISAQVANNLATGSALCPGSGTLYLAFAASTSRAQAHIVTVDLAAKTATAVVLAQGAPIAMAINCTGGGPGVLYGAYVVGSTGDMQLARIDPSTGVVVTVNAGGQRGDLDTQFTYDPVSDSFLGSLLPGTGNDVKLWVVSAGSSSGGAIYKVPYYLAGAVAAAGVSA